jgi:hypothetical protein
MDLIIPHLTKNHQINPKNGKVTTYYRYIDCDKIIFENPSSQILQIPRFTHTNNDVGINENLDYFRQLDCTHLDGCSKQSKIIQTHTDSRIKNTLCESGNLENLGISVNLDSKTNIQEIVEKSEESNLLTTPEGMAKAWKLDGLEKYLSFLLILRLMILKVVGLTPIDPR